MLSEAERIRIVGSEQDADVVHTIGTVNVRTPGSGRRVHTVDHIPLRTGQLAPAAWWVRNVRHDVPRTASWLTHGRTAGRLLVDAGVAPGERVYCLSLLPPLSRLTWLSPALPNRSTRAAIRNLLGIAPGVRLVLGVEPTTSRPGAGEWAAAVAGLRRPDVAVVQIRPGQNADADFWRVRLATGRELPDALGLAELLVAADLYVAAGHGLAACNPGTAAVASGLPLIAVTTDSAAELVRSGTTGYVVPPRADCVARAVDAQVEAGLPARGLTGGDPPQAPRLAELAHELLAAYRRALSSPLARTMGGAA
jgi:hypothetical protein